MTTILETLKYAGDTIHGGDPQDAGIAKMWEDAGFASGEECEAWWDKNCFDADKTAVLRDAGIVPDNLASSDIGYRFCNSDISLRDVMSLLEDD